MEWNSTGLDIVAAALVVAGIAAVVHVVGSSRFGRLIGVHEDGPLLLNPVGARLQGIVVGYVALLVAAGALVYAAVEPVTETSALPWTLSWVAAVCLAAVTLRRVSEHTLLMLGGRMAVMDDVDPQDVLAPDPCGADRDLRDALDAAHRGEWVPAAALLAATADPDVRSDRLAVLCEESVHDGQWVEEWLAARPGDPLVALVRAWVAIQRAWSARGAAYASRTSTEQMRAFEASLVQAERLARAAADQLPDDPAPYEAMLWVSIGRGASADEFRGLLDGLLERGRHHARGHHAGLQLLAPKWYGDSEQMFAFARERAALAPAGSQVCLLPVTAHIEQYLHLTSSRSGERAALRHMTSLATRTELAECQTRWEAADRGGPHPGNHRFALDELAYAWWLAGEQDRTRALLERIGRDFGEFPWAYSGDAGQVVATARRWAGLTPAAPPGPRGLPELTDH